MALGLASIPVECSRGGLRLRCYKEGVDDWNKSPSFVDAPTPRSIFSLCASLDRVALR
jgi:hypothetical protein